MYTLITGATGGIGRAFCLECASRGYDLIITGRSTEKLNALSSELKGFGVSVKAVDCDLSLKEGRQTLIDFITHNALPLKRLFLVAGVDTQMAFESYTTKKVEFQLGVNADANVCLTHALLPKLVDSGEILVISSMSGVSPMPYFALYSATKAMLTNFFTSLHYELKGRKIKVTTILPGGVYTRPDVIQDIKGQGLWGKLSGVAPKFVVKKSLKAIKRNKITFVPGFFNKLLYAIMKIAPKRWVLGFIARRWKKQTKDAFKAQGEL